MTDTGTEAQFLAYLSEGRFMLQRDPISGRAVFPPRQRMPGTGTPLGDWVEMSGRGTVHAITIQQKRDAAARAIVLVDLDEGGRMLSQMTGIEADAVAIGDAVQARVVADAEIPHVVFEPAKGAI